MIRALSYSKTLGCTNDIIIKLQRIFTRKWDWRARILFIFTLWSSSSASNILQYTGVYIHTYTYIHTYIHAYTTYMHTHSHTYTNTRIHNAHIRTYICVYYI